MNNASVKQYVDKLPAYLRDYDKFYKFIETLIDYICDCKRLLVNVANLFSDYALGRKGTSTSSETLDRAVLCMLSDDMGIAYDSTITSEVLYATILSQASRTRGNVCLQDVLDSFPAQGTSALWLESVEDNNDMSANIKMGGSILGINPEYVRTVVFPNITGVSVNVQYLAGDLFAFDHKSCPAPDNSGYRFEGWDTGRWVIEQAN